ncbi:MAG: right-handed parallel beta-helix repeat-containing protein, partial [Patescibacteria group bacterium]
MSQGVYHCEYFVKFSWLSLKLFRIGVLFIWGAFVAAYFFIFGSKIAWAQPTYLAANYQIDQPITWSVDNSPYIVQGQGIIQVNSTLTIEPGVVIKFRPDRFNLRYNGIQVNPGGQILAEGLADSKIVFTSWHDDETLGDTNEDGFQTTPQPGDWLGIIFEGDVSSFLYVDVYYAGAGFYPTLEIGQNSTAKFNNCSVGQGGGSGLLIKENSSPNLSNLLIQNNQGVGLESWLAGQKVELLNSIIQSNKGGAVKIKADNSLFFNNVSFIDNLPQRVEIISKTFNYDTVWQYLEGLYYESFLPGKHLIKTGISLTIEPGVIFYLAKTAGLYVQGSLAALGAADKRIIFTSAGDRPGSTASPGDWGGLYAA